jgi:hypothetical protein
MGVDIMNILQIGILIFTFIEFLNIMVLYFEPTFKYGNSVGVFKDYEGTPFQSYLVNWVAGTKLIFIMMGIVVLVLGSVEVQFWTCVVMVISIASFYFRLYPLIKKMDLDGRNEPAGYHKTLNLMIISFIVLFITVSVIGYIQFF